MKRYAAHQLLISKSDAPRKLSIVVLRERQVESVLPLSEEESFTEWIGGLILLSFQSDCTLASSVDLELFKQQILPDHSPLNEKGESLSEHPLYAWHISSEELSNGSLVHPRLLPSLIF